MTERYTEAEDDPFQGIADVEYEFAQGTKGSGDYPYRMLDRIEELAVKAVREGADPAMAYRRIAESCSVLTGAMGARGTDMYRQDFATVARTYQVAANILDAHSQAEVPHD